MFFKKEKQWDAKKCVIIKEKLGKTEIRTRIQKRNNKILGNIIKIKLNNK